MLIHRRDILKAVAAAFAFPTLQLEAAEPGKPLFFTPEEFALLDCLTELIIPADDHSPGAHAAGVAAYIDRTTAEAINPEDKQSWQKGLRGIEAASQQTHDSPFMQVQKPQQVELLSRIEKGKDPFFGQLKDSTAFAYYSSSIGIHDDIQYKGNVILEQFVGYEAT